MRVAVLKIRLCTQQNWPNNHGHSNVGRNLRNAGQQNEIQIDFVSWMLFRKIESQLYQQIL